MFKITALLIATCTLPVTMALAQTQGTDPHGHAPEASTQSGQMPMGGQMPMMSMMTGKPASEASQGYMQAMQTMMQDMMQMSMTDDPTKDFVLMMIPHHQSAIDMANVLLKQQNVDPEIRTIAEKIASGQQAEIDAFQKWLEKNR